MTEDNKYLLNIILVLVVILLLSPILYFLSIENEEIKEEKDLSYLSLNSSSDYIDISDINQSDIWYHWAEVYGGYYLNGDKLGE